MSNSRFPYVPPEVLRELEKRFPERSPELGESHDQLMFRGGARSVIRFLSMQVEDQSRNKLTGDP